MGYPLLTSLKNWEYEVMHVKVKFAAGASSMAGMREICIKANPDPLVTLKLIEKQTGFPIRDKMGKEYTLLVNGKSFKTIQKEGIMIKEGDTILVVPFIGGG